MRTVTAPLAGGFRRDRFSEGLQSEAADGPQENTGVHHEASALFLKDKGFCRMVCVSDPKFISQASSQRDAGSKVLVVPTQSTHVKRRQNFGHTIAASLDALTHTPVGDLAHSPTAITHHPA